MSDSQADQFWAQLARKHVQWRKPFKQVSDWQFQSPVKVSWFADGELNVSENCLDRHIAQHGSKAALICEPDDPNGQTQIWSYKKLLDETCQLANALKVAGVKKGDRVIIYLPMVPQAMASMLACARIGAVHCVVFAGFSSESLADRMKDCQSSVVITADDVVRGGKHIPLKEQVDRALQIYSKNKLTVVLRHTNRAVSMGPQDVWYHDFIAPQAKVCEPTPMNAEDPLFILYTSGSTNKPKGVLHTSGGYLVYATYTFLEVFGYKESEIYFSTADIGWITGHSYLVYGPLASGASIVLYEGVPNYPDPSRLWQIVDKHNVNIVYTAPTAIRALMREGDGWVKKTSRKSLRLLGSVGEPINPEAWQWYHQVVGDGRIPIVDTWWQTETGGILISPTRKSATQEKQKPGSATKPLPFIAPVLVDDKGTLVVGEGQGNLCIQSSWPGQMRTVFGDHGRFEQTYFSTYPGMYFTGDGCRRDKEGDYWITGRVDDVLNVSGHRIGTAEVESALVENSAVAEAAVVGMPHDIKGQGIFAFVLLKQNIVESEQLASNIRETVKTHIGPLAKPDTILFAGNLPKTRSGKIMRRILRKIVEGDEAHIGDTSTLADPKVVDDLLSKFKSKIIY